MKIYLLGGGRIASLWPPFCARSLIAGVKPGKPLAVSAKRRLQLPEVWRGGVDATSSERFFRLYPETIAIINKLVLDEKGVAAGYIFLEQNGC